MGPSTPDEIEGMQDVPYMQAIGSLQFAAQVTRPDICYAVNLLSRFGQNPGKCHWSAIKRIFRYLKGTIDKQIVYQRRYDELKGFCDADWASDLDERRSTSGYIYTMQAGAISWATKRQKTIALSTTEAEFMSMVSAIQELVWLRRLYTQLVPNEPVQITLNCDNKSAIAYATNNNYSAQTKHIEIRANFIKEKVESGIIKLLYLQTDHNVADFLTKGVTTAKQILFSSKIGLK